MLPAMLVDAKFKAVVLTLIVFAVGSSQDKVKSSMAEVGRVPLPVEAVKVKSAARSGDYSNMP